MDIEHFNYNSMLGQLWNAAVAIFPTSPALSQSYMRKLFRVAHDQQITLSNSLYWNACSHCGCLWYPSITCNPHLYTFRRLRRIVKNAKLKFLLMSKIMSKHEADNDAKEKKTTRHKYYYMTYECMSCSITSIFDGFPLPLSSVSLPRDQPGIPIKTTNNITIEEQKNPFPKIKLQHKKKIGQLQKILERSTRKEDNASDGLSLGNFLKSLGNKR